MKAKKRLGIWMDHSTANIIEYNTDNYAVKTIESHFTEQPVKQENLNYSEKTIHNKENKALQTYYKELMDVIKNYDEILLFGPTEAKTELHNLIKKEHSFEHQFIQTKSSNKMSYNEQYLFIKDYFSKLLNYDNPFNK